MKFVVVLLAALATVNARAYNFNVTEPEGRITNGREDVPGESPFQVMLLLEQRALCGGSIIDKRHLLTAAHCVYRMKFGRALMGSTVVATATTIRDFTYNDIYIHSGWNAKLARNDISIIKVAEITFSPMVQPVRLETGDWNLVGHVATTTGWGSVSDGEFNGPRALQTVDLEIMTNKKCRETFKLFITKATICTDTTGGRSHCFGDSGGPLVLKSTKTQIGISSFVSNAGCTKGRPAVYTRVSQYTSWIRQILSL